MRKYFLLLLTLSALGSCVLAAPKKATAKRPLPVWKPAPALLKQLAPQSDLPFGTIRLPRGYEYFDFPVPFEVGTNISWGKKSPTGEVRYIFLIAQIPAEELGWQNISLEKTLQGYMNGFYARFYNAKRTPAKQGLINGMRTLRTDWQGTYRTTGVKLQGSVFIMKDSTDVYVIQTGHQVGAPAENRFTEAAALTFKIQPQN